MEITKLNEAGLREALYGLGLSFSRTSKLSINEISIPDLLRTARTLAHKQGGHNKFLESIIVWFSVTAPRYFWQEADTYRLSTKQSESTIHTITRKPLTKSDFVYISDIALEELNFLIQTYKTAEDKEEVFEKLKSSLPEGFLQQRVWCMSYKTLQNVFSQRKHHKIRGWKFFCSEILRQVDNPEFILIDPAQKNIENQ